MRGDQLRRLTLRESEAIDTDPEGTKVFGLCEGTVFEIVQVEAEPDPNGGALLWLKMEEKT